LILEGSAVHELQSFQKRIENRKSIRKEQSWRNQQGCID